MEVDELCIFFCDLGVFDGSRLKLRIILCHEKTLLRTWFSLQKSLEGPKAYICFLPWNNDWSLEQTCK